MSDAPGLCAKAVSTSSETRWIVSLPVYCPLHFLQSIQAVKRWLPSAAAVAEGRADVAHPDVFRIGEGPHDRLRHVGNAADFRLDRDESALQRRGEPLAVPEAEHEQHVELRMVRDDKRVTTAADTVLHGRFGMRGPDVHAGNAKRDVEALESAVRESASGLANALRN